MPDEPPREPTRLTDAEEDMRSRAAQLLERTAYDGDAPERVTDARMVARGVLDLAATLEAERSARVALQRRCEEQQAILGRHAGAATPEP